MRTLFLLLVAMAAACGGGGGDGPLPSATLSGTLSVITAVPQLAVSEPADGRLVDVRLAQGERAPEGRVDAQGDRIDAMRYVATAGGVLSVRVEADGADVDAVLFDLERGVSGRTLAVAPGTVYDVVVSARAGAGRYRAIVEPADDPAERFAPLPEGYLDCGDGHVTGEIVVAPLEGVDPARLEAAEGLVFERGRGTWLLRMRRPDREDATRDLCHVLGCCARLRHAGLVRYAEPNFVRRLAGTPDDPLFSSQWGLEHIRAAAAWTVFDGASDPIVIGFIDSGIQAAHPDLQGRIDAGYDFVDDDADPTDLMAAQSHGTSTASIAAAIPDNGTGMSGVHWGARILPCRAFNPVGFGVSFDIGNAILFAAGLDNFSGMLPTTPARVINMSFATTTQAQVERDACEAAHAAGIFLVASAGNSDRSTVHFPAGYDTVFTVAATTHDSDKASYSNWGGWIDLTAPGGEPHDGIVVATMTASQTLSYTTVHGTSFSAPHVAGVAALVLGVRDLDPGEMASLLKATARDLGVAGPDAFFGYGRVDAYSALIAALEQDAPPLIPGETLHVRVLNLSGSVAFATTTTQATSLRWSVRELAPGSYRIEAGTDRDFDGEIDDAGELFGRWPNPAGGDVLTVGADENRNDLDFVLQLR